jgi:hypothetical protein
MSQFQDRPCPVSLRPQPWPESLTQGTRRTQRGRTATELREALVGAGTFLSADGAQGAGANVPEGRLIWGQTPLTGADLAVPLGQGSLLSCGLDTWSLVLIAKRWPILLLSTKDSHTVTWSPGTSIGTGLTGSRLER